jgi:hypothetical protein
MRPLIKLAFRQIIDASARPGFEQNVFNDTYQELQMQAHVYNREKTFTKVSEMIAANPKANSLHYKVGFAIGLYVNELNKIIPDFADSLGNPIAFEIFKTEIVQSDINERSKHVIALTYMTAPLLLVASFGEYLVLSKSADAYPDEMETFTVPLQAGLSIVNYKMIQEV